MSRCNDEKNMWKEIDKITREFFKKYPQTKERRDLARNCNDD